MERRGLMTIGVETANSNLALLTVRQPDNSGLYAVLDNFNPTPPDPKLFNKPKGNCIVIDNPYPL